MMWSKLKQNIENGFASSTGKRVKLHITRYTSGSHFMARGWITIDGIEVANFSNPENYSKYGWNTPEPAVRVEPTDRHSDNAVEKGEFSRYDLLDACWNYMNLSIDNALHSDNPIIVAFAMLDRRLGKRRLLKIDPAALHPLAKRMFELRMECESTALVRQ